MKASQGWPVLEVESGKVFGDLNTWRCLFPPNWWNPLCRSQMTMAHTSWNSIALEDSRWCSWSLWGLCSQVEGQRDFYGTGISCNLQYGHIDRGLKGSSVAAAHGPSPVWDPQQAPSPPGNTLSLCPVMWSYIFCEISFVPLRDWPQQSAKPEDKLERSINLISTVLELRTSFSKSGHRSDHDSDFITAPDCNV